MSEPIFLGFTTPEQDDRLIESIRKIQENIERNRMASTWNDTGTDEGVEFSKTSARPVIAIADGVIGCWRELEENESPHTAIRSYVDSYEGEWDELRVWVYEGGETECAMVVRPDSAILHVAGDDEYNPDE